MSEAHAHSRFFGSHRYGHLYDIEQGANIPFPPGGEAELDELSTIMWRLIYPIYVTNECRKVIAE